MNAQELEKLEGQTAELRFKDGQVVVARILDVDLGSPGRELIYDVVEVLSSGSIDQGRIDADVVAAASIDELASVIPVVG